MTALRNDLSDLKDALEFIIENEIKQEAYEKQLQEWKEKGLE